VAPGPHEVFLKIDWCRSERVDVDLAPDETARFRCGAQANFLTGLYWSTFGRRRYIRLTRLTS
jgi:hypothetical protein